MKATLTSALALSAALLLTAAGCGEEEPAPPATGAQSGVLPADIGSKVGEAAKETAGALAKNYASELDKQESRIDSLTASALTLADDRLNELIGAIETKLEAARGKLDEIRTADEGSMQALSSEMSALMSELQQLYQQALDRVGELREA